MDTHPSPDQRGTVPAWAAFPPQYANLEIAIARISHLDELALIRASYIGMAAEELFAEMASDLYAQIGTYVHDLDPEELAWTLEQAVIHAHEHAGGADLFSEDEVVAAAEALAPSFFVLAVGEGLACREALGFARGTWAALVGGDLFDGTAGLGSDWEDEVANAAPGLRGPLSLIS
jgi:hypothetical protein